MDNLFYKTRSRLLRFIAGDSVVILNAKITVQNIRGVEVDNIDDGIICDNEFITESEFYPNVGVNYHGLLIEQNTTN